MQLSESSQVFLTNVPSLYLLKDDINLCLFVFVEPLSIDGLLKQL